MENFAPEGLGATIFRERYARNGEESWEEAARRIADHVAAAEDNGKIKKYADRFYDQIVTGRFFPGGRIVYGAGRPKAQLLNCFVISTSDSREGWAKSTSDVIIISSLMGGVGANFTPIRPRGSIIKGTGGRATGAVSLMRLINGVGNEIVGGGGRRMALMMCLGVNHPDLPEFLNSKFEQGELNNANISVVINFDTEEFIEKVKNNEEIEFEFNNLSWPNRVEVNGELQEIFSINAKELWNSIVENAWRNGEPGVLNQDYANKTNNIWYHKPLVSTNPSMPAGTLVATKDGIFPIEFLEGKIFKVKSLDGNWAQAECFLSGEDEEILEISFGNNRVTHSTKEHRWPVYDKRMDRIYKLYANELKPGDLIPLNRNELTGICGDESLTEEDGFFMGYSFGDGWVSQRKTGMETGKLTMGVIFPQQDYSIAERMTAFANKNKSHLSTLTLDRDDNFVLQITDQEFIKTKAYLSKDRLPQIIWSSNDEFIRGFIDGLYSADGHISDENANNPVIDFTTCRREVAVELSKLLSFYGIPSTICGSKREGNFSNKKDYKKEYERWDVRISRGSIINFANIFDISHTQKGDKLAKLAAKEYRTSDKSRFAEIKSIELIGRSKVWDISVDYHQHVFPSQYVYTGNCGEIWLEEYGCCDLGALVLPKFVKDGKLDWDELDETIRMGVRFLDDVLTVNHYPLEEIKQNCEEVRRIGLGVMGLHTMLMALGMKYNSKEGFEFVDKLFSTIKNTAYDASINLAIEKGPFPAYDPRLLESGFAKTLKRGIRNKIREHGLRNCALLTIAPTGTTSLVAGVSSGIEPVPAPVHWRTYFKNTKDGRRAREKELVVDKSYFLYPDVIQGAADIPVEDHFEMQKIVQRHIDNAVSKTINLPNNYELSDLSELWLEYLPFMKGSTLYRWGSREHEPISPIPREEWEEVIASQNGNTTFDFDVEQFLLLDCPGGVCALPEQWGREIELANA